MKKTTVNIELILELYLMGRRIRSESKHKNEDKVLDAVIMQLTGLKNLTVSNMASLLSTKISAVSEKIIKLEENGFIKKIKGQNNRESYLLLTQKGLEEKEKIMQIMSNHCLKIFSSLNDKEQKNLLGLIKKITISA